MPYHDIELHGPERGWDTPKGARKFHFFYQGKSLCEHWENLGAPRTMTGFCPPMGDRCKDCLRVIERYNCGVKPPWQR